MLFRAVGYILFGLVLEVCFTALSQVLDGKITKEDRLLKGSVSLWMVPVYPLIVIGFEPVYSVICQWPVLARFAAWAVLIPAIEALTGWLYDHFLQLKPWDYSKAKDKIFKGGYTRWLYVPLWGLVGLGLELYVQFLASLSPYAAEAARLVVFHW